MVRWILHLEGLTVAVLATYAYARTDGSWWTYNVFLLLPDVSIAAYLVNPRVGAIIYNAAHTYIAAGLLIALGMSLLPAMLPYGLIWAAHIGLDRCLNYGLKYPDAFKSQHMSRV